MPLQTDLNRAPYNDDYEEGKDYAKILFQPGVSVQTREFNQLQTMVQKQIERMGDNLFKQGTIVSGCNFVFYPAYSYVKIMDNEVDGTAAVIASYADQYAVCESSGLKAQIRSVVDGFESSDPDLKTLYVRYQNSGNDGLTNAFTSGDVLTIRDLQNSIYKVQVTDGGSGFSNSDSIVSLPQLIINVASGSYSNGDYVVGPSGANVQIVGIDSQTYAAKSQLLIKVAPRIDDLTSAVSTPNNWSFSINDTITNPANTISARVEGVVGSGFRGRIITNGVGKVQAVAVLSRGQGYTSIPYVTIKSANNSTGLNQLSLTPRNYIGQVQIASVSQSVGNGYAFGISDGVIYQKGYLLRVEPQIMIVDKYGTTPNAVSCGFQTEETIVNYNVDPTLRDPVNNTDNQGAPGADRLQLVPKLVLSNTDVGDSNADFFTIVSWNEGNPYRQNQYTAYNKIQDEIAVATKEESGNFVVDSFLMSTRSPIDPTKEGSTYSVVLDPGTAYIEGYRVQTLTNFTIDVPKAFESQVTNNHSVNLNYGNYVFVNNAVGVFQFNTGDTVDLYDTAKGYLANSAAIVAGTIAPAGNKIGTAAIRSMVIDEGQPGSPDAIYRLYVFNVTMNQGKNFRDVRSVYYNSTASDGVADVVLDVDGTTSANIAVLKETDRSTLLFPAGVESLKNATDVSYIYRTLDQTTSVANTGVLVKSIASTPDEFFPYTGALTSAQMQELYVVPTAIDLVSSANLTGNTSLSTTSANLVGNGTQFLTELRSGDYIYAYANGTAHQLKKVVQVVNNTLIVLDSNGSFTNTVTKIQRAWPVNVPVPFGYRSGLTANVDSNQNILTLDFGTPLSGSTSANVALGVNIRRTNVTQSTKTPNRSKFVKINLSTNDGGVTGPWCLGVPDIFRCRGVYIGGSTVDNTGANALNSFYIDHNQNPDFYDLGYLYLAPKSSVKLNSSQYLLVEFDYFTTDGVGYTDVVSYVSANVAQRILVDSQPLANLTTTVNSFEIPEVFDNQGKEYDLMSYFDFRPVAVATVTPGVNASAAPVNPSSVVSFGNTTSQANEKKFPLPGTQFLCTVDEFLGRTDSVVIAQDGNIEVLQGKPAQDPNKRFAPPVPAQTMKLTDLVVPPYPNLPIVRSTNINQILTTYVMNGRFLKMRTDSKAITKPRSQSGAVFDIPKVYTMADIGHLDRRLSDVEYYISLRMLEQNVISSAIPSSVDPSLNRFKYGFFADDLTTYAFSDRENPSYAAYIEDNAAVPEKLTWDAYLADTIGGPDFVDQLIVSQENATWPDTLGPVCVLQYVTYNVFKKGNQYYLNTGSTSTTSTPPTAIQFNGPSWLSPGPGWSEVPLI